MGKTCTPNTPSCFFHLRPHSDFLPLCVLPCLFLPQGHAHRNATQHMDKRCSPHLVLSALLSDNHSATYAFSGKRCPPIPPSLSSNPPVSVLHTSLLFHVCLSSLRYFLHFHHCAPYERLPSFHPGMLLFTSHFLRCISEEPISLSRPLTSSTYLPLSTILARFVSSLDPLNL